jgi:hypothetical protein
VWEKSSLITFIGSNPAENLPLDFQPPKLWHNKFLLCNPPTLWYFVSDSTSKLIWCYKHLCTGFCMNKNLHFPEINAQESSCGS